MPFLTLNGWEIPVREIKETNEYLGSIKRVFKGSARPFNYARKRKWEVVTTPLPIETAEALKKFIVGEGDHFSFSHVKNYSNSTTDIYSDKGIALSSGQGVLYYDNTLDHVVLGMNNTSVTNLLTPNQASFETDLSGWIIYNLDNRLSITKSSEDAYHGSSCLKVAYSSSGDTAWSISTTVSNITAGTRYILSWYERHPLLDLSNVSGTIVPKIEWLDSGDNVISTSTLTNLGAFIDKWHRHYIDSVAPSNAVKARLTIGWDSPNFNIRYRYYYIDAIQFQSAGIYEGPSPFVISSQNYSNIYFPSNFEISNSNKFSIIFDILLNTTEMVTIQCFILYSALAPYYYKVYIGLNTSKLYIVTFDNNLNTISYLHSTQFTPYTWGNIAITYNGDTIKAFLNGVLVWSYNSSIIDIPNTQPCIYAQKISIGDIYLLPYALPDEAVAGIANYPYTSSFPELIASGDFVQNPIYVLGEVTDCDYIQYYYQNTWTTGQILKFTLYEV